MVQGINGSNRTNDVAFRKTSPVNPESAKVDMQMKSTPAEPKIDKLEVTGETSPQEPAAVAQDLNAVVDTKVDEKGNTISYNKNGNVVQVKDKDGNLSKEVVYDPSGCKTVKNEYGIDKYDQKGRLVYKESEFGGYSRISSIKYNTDGSYVEKYRMSTDEGNLLSSEVNFYNNKNQLIHKDKFYDNTDKVDSVDITYDEDGSRTEVYSSGDTRGYDSQGREILFKSEYGYLSKTTYNKDGSYTKVDSDGNKTKYNSQGEILE